MEPMDFPAERGAVVETATRYYGTMVAGDEAVLRQLFENRAPIVGYYQNEFLWLTLNDVIDETKSLIGQHGEEECSVESVRIDGNMATVAKRDRYAGAWFLDHLSIFQVNDRWTIAGKSFHVLA